MTPASNDQEMALVDLSDLPLPELLESEDTALMAALRRVAELANRHTDTVAGFNSVVD